MRRMLVVGVIAVTACAPVDGGPARPRRDGGPRDTGIDAPDAPDARPDSGQWSHVDPFVVQARPTALRVRRGGATALAISVAREPGFAAPVSVSAWGLPDGVEAAAVTAHDGEAIVTMRIEASQEAELGIAPFAVSASAAGVRENLRITVEVGP